MMYRGMIPVAAGKALAGKMDGSDNVMIYNACNVTKNIPDNTTVRS